jgi:hypothetical protein
MRPTTAAPDRAIVQQIGSPNFWFKLIFTGGERQNISNRLIVPISTPWKIWGLKACV